MSSRSYNHPGWLVMHYQNKILYPLFSKYIKGNLLDIGCGEKPYEKKLKKYVKSHIGVDHYSMIHNKNKVDIFADAYNIPLEDNSIDSVLCTEVIEHLEEPKKCFKEISRLLKSKGYGIITSPFVWHLHEQPRDFYRYTKHGLKYLAESNNLKVIKIISKGGLFLSFFTEIAYCINEITDSKFLKPFQMILINFILLIAYILNKVDPTKDIFPIGYVMLIQK